MQIILHSSKNSKTSLFTLLSQETFLWIILESSLGDDMKYTDFSLV